MHIATAHLQSISPYSQSRFHAAPALDKENKEDWERRTWRQRLHVNGEGQVFIPPMSFKNCLAEAAKFLNLQIPGGGKRTYTVDYSRLADADKARHNAALSALTVIAAASRRDTLAKLEGRAAAAQQRLPLAETLAALGGAPTEETAS